MQVSSCVPLACQACTRHRIAIAIGLRVVDRVSVHGWKMKRNNFVLQLSPSLCLSCCDLVTSKSKIASNNSDCRPTITGNDHVCINLQCQASEFYQENGNSKTRQSTSPDDANSKVTSRARGESIKTLPNQIGSFEAD